MIEPSFSLLAGTPPHRNHRRPRGWRPLLHALLPALSVVLLLTGAAVASAQITHAAPAVPGADPTRPPLPNAAPRAQAAASAASAPRPAAAAALPQLQALFQPHGATEPSALVDGRLLRVGDRLGDWSLHEIGRDAIWLRSTRGQRLRLALLPALQPETAGPGAATPSAAASATPHATDRKKP